MDLFGEENPLCMGRPGTLAPRGANFAMQNSDFLLTVGTRMDVPVAGWNRKELARDAYKVMVDVDAAELAKLSDVVQMPICADAGSFLREMLAQKASLQLENPMQRLEKPLPGHSGRASRKRSSKCLPPSRSDFAIGGKGRSDRLRKLRHGD